MLVSRYEREDGQLDGWGCKGSRWWRDICSLKNLNNKFREKWFSEALIRRLGDGGIHAFGITIGHKGML